MFVFHRTIEQLHTSIRTSFLFDTIGLHIASTNFNTLDTQSHHESRMRITRASKVGLTVQAELFSTSTREFQGVLNPITSGSAKGWQGIKARYLRTCPSSHFRSSIARYRDTRWCSLKTVFACPRSCKPEDVHRLSQKSLGNSMCARNLLPHRHKTTH